MQKLINGLIKYVGGAAAVFITWQLVKGGLIGAGKSAAYLSAKDSPEGLQAIRLDQAMNPSGWEISREVDGTDEEEILATAATITNLDKVSEWYKRIAPGRNLIEDLQNELNSNDFQQFMQLVKNRGGANNGRMKTEASPQKTTSTARQSGGGTKPNFKKRHGQTLITAVENVKLHKRPNRQSCILFSVPRKNENIGVVIARTTVRNENFYRVSINEKLAWVSEAKIK